MTKARDLSKLLGTNTNGVIPSGNLDVDFENITDTGTEGTKVATGTTAQRGSTTGQWRYNSTTGKFEGRGASDFFSLEPTPTVSGVDVTEVDSAAGGTQTFVISGTNFSSGGTVYFVGADGTEYIANSTTFDSTTQLTAVEDKSTFSNSNEPYKIKFLSATGASGESGNLIYQDQNPAWSTAAGNLGSFLEGSSVGTIQLSATDPDSDTVTYSETTSALSGAGLSLNSSNGQITGTTAAVSGDTTTNFTIRATANSKNVDRNFNIITKNLNVDALLFDATNITGTTNETFTSNTNGQNVGLTLDNGNSISVNTAVTLSRINGVNNGTGTLANGKMLSDYTLLTSHYNNSNKKNWGNTFWTVSRGSGQHSNTYNNAWFGIYSSGSPSSGHIWMTWDFGDNPSVKLKRMTNNWTWRTGSAQFWVYGSNSLPNGGSAMTSSFSSTGLTQLFTDTTLSATEDNSFSNTDFYRYYVFRLQGGGSYDYGLDVTKWYGDYY